MQVYLSSRDSDDFFVRATLKAVQNVNEDIGREILSVIFPPRGIGGDLGRIDLNVARLIQSDVILSNVSPESVNGHHVYNPGVMIEYGMLFAADISTPPWGGRLPLPIHRVYCDSTVDRATLTPILNRESVQTVERSDEGYKGLVAALADLLMERVMEKIDFIHAPTPERQL